MKFKFLMLVLLFIMSISLVHAKDITLSLDQKEYYFSVGQNAIIDLKSDNTYKEPISGILTYSITQSMNQGGFQYSNTNTQSKSLTLEKEEMDLPLNFGVADSPMTLIVGLRFSFTKKQSREVVLDDIKIYFVSDDSQKNNQENQVKSSSQKTQSKKQQQDPFAQQEKKMQQMMQNMFSNQQQQPQSAQQKLQNNQMSQDSSALKKQIQKQLSEQQKIHEEFQKKVEQDQELLKEHQSMLNKGFEMNNGNVNPISKDSGSFELNYQNKEGEEASLFGDFQNGTLSNLEKNTPETREKIMEQLSQNKKYQKYQGQLKKQGFSEQEVDISKDGNVTVVSQNYVNENNETATIKAQVVNNTIKKVELDKSKDKRNYFWVVVFLVLLSILGYIWYNKLKKEKTPEGIKKTVEKPLDYRKESFRMLEKAKKLFDKKEFKDAYMLAAQSLRLYLSYENNLKKEITNDEVLNSIRKNKKHYKDAKECFDLCSLVEFAKYEANKNDFEKIVSYVEKMLYVK